MSITVYDQQRNYIEQHPDVKNQLHDVMSSNLVAETSDASWQSTMYQTAYVATFVFYVIAAVGGLIALNVLYPEFLLVGALVGIPISLSLLSNLTTWLREKNEANERIHTITTKVLDKVRDLETKTPNEITQLLTNETPNWNRSASVLSEIDNSSQRTYLPVLAQLHYWKEIAATKETAVRTLRDEASTLQNEFAQAPEEEREEKYLNIYSKLENAYQIEEKEVLPAKIRAAFMIYVLQNPLKVQDGNALVSKAIADFGGTVSMPAESRFLLQSNQFEPYWRKTDGTLLNRSDFITDSLQATARKLFGTS